MRRFSLAQLERAIYYWRKHREHMQMYQNSSDGERQERLLTALYGRLIGQRQGSIGLDELTSAEFAALGCLYGVVPVAEDGKRLMG